MTPFDPDTQVPVLLARQLPEAEQPVEVVLDAVPRIAVDQPPLLLEDAVARSALTA